MTTLKIYKTHPDIVLPKFATDESACFDIAFQGQGKHEYQGYNRANKKFTRPTPKGQVFINSGERVMVPTGLIFDIPKGYSVRLHARSGLSFKSGLILANCEAVIDSDFVEEVQILLYNRTDVGVWLNPGDRLAQGELVKQIKYDIEAISEAPTKKTNRDGGIGSTGINS
jgi:dUTP pyrophosphatase